MTIKFSNTENAINELINDLYVIIKKTMPFNTGGLRNSLNINLKNKHPNYIISITYKKYGDYIDEGTKPHMPPISSLKKWSEKKGLNVWSLAKSIEKKGTKAKPWKYVIYTTIDEHMRKIKKAYEEDILIIMKNKLK